jgi:hypothetical protein
MSWELYYLHGTDRALSWRLVTLDPWISRDWGSSIWAKGMCRSLCKIVQDGCLRWKVISLWEVNVTCFMWNHDEVYFIMRICELFVDCKKLFTSVLLHNCRGKRTYETNVEVSISYVKQGSSNVSKNWAVYFYDLSFVLLEVDVVVLRQVTVGNVRCCAYSMLFN